MGSGAPSKYADDLHEASPAQLQATLSELSHEDLKKLVDNGLAALEKKSKVKTTDALLADLGDDILDIELFRKIVGEGGAWSYHGGQCAWGEDKDWHQRQFDQMKDGTGHITQKQLKEFLGHRTYYDYNTIRDALADDKVVLINAEWLASYAATGKSLPRRQDLPPEAIYRGPVEMNKVLIICISYCWLSKRHPDPDGAQLRYIAKIYQILIRFGNVPNRGTPLQKRAVVFFWDWLSLPQEPRSDEDKQLFKSGLKYLNSFYMHTKTYTWMFCDFGAKWIGAKAHDERPGYPDSGWTVFEKAVSELIATDILDISLAGRNGHNLDTLGDWFAIMGICGSARSLPMVPEEFEKLIRTKKFTNNADMDQIVLPRYREAFQAATTNAEGFVFADNIVGAGKEDWEAFFKTVLPIGGPNGSMERLTFKGCKGLEVDLADIVKYCPDLEMLQCENVKVHGDIACLEKCPRLTWLYLMNTECHGDVAVFRHFPEMHHFNLAGTKGISGDIQAFVVMLSRPGWHGGCVLKGTSITGNFQAMQERFPNKVHHD